MVLIIKSWQNEIIANLGIIPEFIREKGTTGYFGSISTNQWKEEMDFPGIPEKWKLILIDDLIQYVKSGESGISGEL